jgi:hypothetical protein
MPWHMIQWDNNRLACVDTEEDDRFSLGRLTELSHRFGCVVHASALMTSQVPWRRTLERADRAQLTMKHFG